MSGNLLDIRKRIKSVKNTRQVTKAMEAVAASKMRKSVERAVAAKEYASLANEMIQNVTHSQIALLHPYVRGMGGERTLILLITSDRGLCGAYNVWVSKAALDYSQNVGMEKVDFVCMGKKGQNVLRRVGKDFIATFASPDKLDSQKTLEVSQFLTSEYSKGTYNKVCIAFTDFKSSIKQVPVVKQLLPISREIEEVAGVEKDVVKQNNNGTQDIDYLYEPSEKSIVEKLIPRLLETQVYQTLLESLASEHMSRMIAMRNATDNASSMIDELTLTYNQARQSAITSEIAEISAGKAALGE